MATVVNKALDGADLPGIADKTDRKLRTYSRTNAGEPNGSLTPAFVGEIVLDTTNNALWYATNSANSGWVTLTTPA